MTAASGDIGSGLPAATSTEVRIIVRGVRSSWATLAMNRRWASNAASRRPRRSSIVSPSCLISSGGPASASRSWRFSCEIRRVRAVISRSGLSTRPATIQPSHVETTAMIASAIPDRTSSVCSTVWRSIPIPIPTFPETGSGLTWNPCGGANWAPRTSR